MESRINYTAVGVFVVVLVAALLGIFFWLSARTGDQAYTEYGIYLRESVSGLNVQSMVRYNGVPVGYVKSINLVPSNPRLVKVMVNIKQGTPVNTSTIATLMSQGITGVDYIGLQSERVDAPTLMVMKGETFPIIPSKPSLLMQLSEVLPEITRKVSQLSDSVSKLFDEENQLNVKQTLANLNQFTKVLDDNSQNLTDVMGNLKNLTQQVSAASNSLPALIKQTRQSLHVADGALSSFKAASDTANRTLQSAQLTLSGLSQQVVPPTQQLLEHLNNMSVDLQTVVNQIKRNPAMFVRGRVPTPAGPGERK